MNLGQSLLTLWFIFYNDAIRPTKNLISFLKIISQTGQKLNTQNAFLIKRLCFILFFLTLESFTGKSFLDTDIFSLGIVSIINVKVTPLCDKMSVQLPESNLNHEIIEGSDHHSHLSFSRYIFTHF